MKHLTLAGLDDRPMPSARFARHGILSREMGRAEVVGANRKRSGLPGRNPRIPRSSSRTADKADSQLKLAAWWDQKGLKAQALTHYEQVIRVDPARDAAWRHLGFKKQGYRWVKADQATAPRQEAEKQKQADRNWRPILEKLRDDLQTKDASRGPGPSGNG